MVEPYSWSPLRNLTMWMPAHDFRCWPELRARLSHEVSARILSSWACVMGPPPTISTYWYWVRREHFDIVAGLTGPAQFTQHPDVHLVTEEMNFAPEDVALCHGYVAGGLWQSSVPSGEQE